jgi:hypothetical protein
LTQVSVRLEVKAKVNNNQNQFSVHYMRTHGKQKDPTHHHLESNSQPAKTLDALHLIFPAA